MRTQHTWGRTALANKTAATWEGLVWDGRFRAKGKGGRVKGERRPSQCIEVPVVAHVTPFGIAMKRAASKPHAVETCASSRLRGSHSRVA